MSDKPVAGWVQAADGKWYHPKVQPPPPAANEATALLRKIARDMATIRGLAVLWSVVYAVGILWVLAHYSG